MHSTVFSNNEKEIKNKKSSRLTKINNKLKLHFQKKLKQSSRSKAVVKRLQKQPPKTSFERELWRHNRRTAPGWCQKRGKSSAPLWPLARRFWSLGPSRSRRRWEACPTSSLLCSSSFCSSVGPHRSERINRCMRKLRTRAKLCGSTLLSF